MINLTEKQEKKILEMITKLSKKRNKIFNLKSIARDLADAEIGDNDNDYQTMMRLYNNFNDLFIDQKPTAIADAIKAAGTAFDIDDDYFGFDDYGYLYSISDEEREKRIYESEKYILKDTSEVLINFLVYDTPTYHYAMTYDLEMASVTLNNLNTFLIEEE